MKTDKSKFFIADDIEIKESLLFRYMEIERIDTAINKAGVNDIVHPVYVILEKDEIVFYFHGSFGPDKEHVNLPFFRVSLFGKRRLEQTLTEELIRAHDDVYDIKNNLYHFKQPYNLTYWSCYHNHLEMIFSNLYDTFHIHHERILLDFIYDFENSDVFKLSSYYDEIYKLLQNEITFMAIFNRAEYMFQRCRCEQIVKVIDEKGKELSQCRDASKSETLRRDINCKEEELSLYRRAFMKSEELWTDIIRKREFESLCLTKSGWFEGNVENEYKEVLEYSLRRKIIGNDKNANFFKEAKEVNKNIDNLSKLISNYSEITINKPATNCQKSDETINDFNTVEKVYEMLKRSNNDSDTKAESEWDEIKEKWKSIKESTKKINGGRKYDSIDIIIKEAKREDDFYKKAIDWYLGRYSIWRALLILCRSHSKKCWKGPAIIIIFFLFSIGICIFLLWYGQTHSRDDKSCYLDIFTVVVFLGPISAIGILCLIYGKKFISLLISRLFITLIITWGGLLFSDKIWNAVSNDSFERMKLVIDSLIIFILSLPPILFIFIQLTRKAPSLTTSKSLGRASFVYVYALVWSTIIGIYLMSFFYEFNWSLNKYRIAHHQISNGPDLLEKKFQNNGANGTSSITKDNKEELADSSDILEHYHEGLFHLGFHFFPKFFFFGAVLAVYLGLFVELGIKNNVVATETALPD